MSSFFNLDASLGQTLLGNGNADLKRNRIPFSFTSLRRLRNVNSALAADLSTRRDNVNTNITTLQTSNQPITPELPVIEMLVNPNSVTWDQPKRITKKDTQEGSVFYHFTNSKGENNDILSCTFRGNTGNIDPRGSIEVGPDQNNFSNTNTGAYQKLLVWHNLWQLTREQILLKDNIINEFIVTYQSIIIPTQITLIGFFNEVMTLEDSAEKPFSKDYSFSFTVQDTIPPLNELQSTIQAATFEEDDTSTGLV